MWTSTFSDYKNQFYQNEQCLIVMNDELYEHLKDYYKL
jgi:hypothetical protein